MPLDETGRPLYQLPLPSAAAAAGGAAPLINSRGCAAAGVASVHKLDIPQQPGATVRITVTAQGDGDLECYAGTMAEPSHQRHQFTNQRGDYMQQAVFDIGPHDVPAELYLAVVPYHCPQGSSYKPLFSAAFDSI